MPCRITRLKHEDFLGHRQAEMTGNELRITLDIVDKVREAIAVAVGEAKEGDILIVAGKGHENYQITGKTVLPFSDVDELAEGVVVELDE